MGSKIFLYRLEKITPQFVENLDHFQHFTPLSAHGQWLTDYKYFNLYEPYFVKAPLTYFNVEKGIQMAGYEMVDVESYQCGHGFNAPRILYPANKDLKLPDAPNCVHFKIKVPEKRRYELYWEYVASMRTYKKPLQQQVLIQNIPLYTQEEYGIYHPEVSVYYGGLNDLFYEQLQNIDNLITNQITAFAFFDQYAEPDHKMPLFKAICEPFVDGETFIRINA